MYASKETTTPRKLRRPYKTGLPVRIPSKRLEYVYYFAVIYSVLAPALGLEIPLLAGGMVLIISALCIIQLQSCARLISRPMLLLLGCGASFVAIQIFIHGESISTVRPYILWMLSLIIVYSLCLRPGFSVRFPLVLFAIGLVVIPFIGINGGDLDLGDMARVEIDVQGGLTHPGGLAEWFGFLAVYFAVMGLQAHRALFRIGLWLICVGCLFVVTLTMERSPLLAAALGIVVACRRLLRRGFTPVFAFVLLTGIVFQTGLFAPAAARYSARGLEDTGRGVIWADAIDRINDSALLGVGESKIFMQFGKKEVPPHNVFLHFALASGVIPFALFLAFWLNVTFRAIRNSGNQNEVCLPFLVFTFVPVMFGDWSYMSYYALLSMSVAAGSAIPYTTQLRDTPLRFRVRSRAVLRTWAPHPTKMRQF